MSSSRKSEERYLDRDERELVAETRHPHLTMMDAESLRNLARRLRERHDRAQTLDRRQRRATVRDDPQQAPGLGNRRKAAMLQSAIARLNKEYARRADT